MGLAPMQGLTGGRLLQSGCTQCFVNPVAGFGHTLKVAAQSLQCLPLLLDFIGGPKAQVTKNWDRRTPALNWKSCYQCRKGKPATIAFARHNCAGKREHGSICLDGALYIPLPI